MQPTAAGYRAGKQLILHVPMSELPSVTAEAAGSGAGPRHAVQANDEDFSVTVSSIEAQRILT